MIEAYFKSPLKRAGEYLWHAYKHPRKRGC